jgi:hypothetical protein
MTNQISIYELIRVIRSSEEDAVKFIETLDNTKYESLLHATKVLTNNEIKDEIFLHRLLFTLIEFSMKDKRAVIVLREALKINKIKIEYQNMVSNYIYSIFLQMLSSRSHSDIAEILTGTYGGYEVNPYEDWYYQVDDLVIKNEVIENLSIKNFNEFIKKLEYKKIDIFNSETSIGKFVIKSSSTYDFSSDEKETSYSNIIYKGIEPIIKSMTIDEFSSLIDIFNFQIDPVDECYHPELGYHEVKKTKKKYVFILTV